MSRLVVRTEDFQLSYKIIQELRKRKLVFSVLEIGSSIPSNDTIWFAHIDEINSSNIVGRPIPTSSDTIEQSDDVAMYLLRGNSSPNLLVIGIDPGPKPGIAWLVDGAIIGISQFNFIDDIIPKIGLLIAASSCNETIIRIGNGAPLDRDRIANLCLEQNWNVEFVDERKTSTGLVRNDHSVSALRIASLSGSKIWQQIDIKPTAGEVKNIQNNSRIKSGGRLTIPRKYAHMVAIGELTLAQAIDNYLIYSSEE